MSILQVSSLKTHLLYCLAEVDKLAQSDSVSKGTKSKGALPASPASAKNLCAVGSCSPLPTEANPRIMTVSAMDVREERDRVGTTQEPALFLASLLPVSTAADDAFCSIRRRPIIPHPGSEEEIIEASLAASDNLIWCELRQQRTDKIAADGTSIGEEMIPCSGGSGSRSADSAPPSEIRYADARQPPKLLRMGETQGCAGTANLHVEDKDLKGGMSCEKGVRSDSEAFPLHMQALQLETALRQQSGHSLQILEPLSETSVQPVSCPRSRNSSSPDMGNHVEPLERPFTFLATDAAAECPDGGDAELQESAR